MRDKKIAVIFPGMGYHSDKPLLYFSKRLAREKDYEIAEVSYEFPYKAKEIMNDRGCMKEAGIVFHGLADPWCKTEIADVKSKELNLELYKIDRANHSLETDSPMEDIYNLQKVMGLVNDFLGRHGNL